LKSAGRVRRSIRTVPNLINGGIESAEGNDRSQPGVQVGGVAISYQCDTYCPAVSVSQGNEVIHESFQLFKISRGLYRGVDDKGDVQPKIGASWKQARGVSSSNVPSYLSGHITRLKEKRCWRELNGNISLTHYLVQHFQTASPPSRIIGDFKDIMLTDNFQKYSKDGALRNISPRR